MSALGGQAIQLTDQLVGSYGSLDQSTQAFSGVLVDDRHDLDRPPIGGGIELRIHCEHAAAGLDGGPVGGRRPRGRSWRWLSL